MPLLDLQRRAVELGRVRIGVKAPTAKGGTRPAKLGVFRFTSRDEVAIRSIASLYGGEPRRWDDAPTDDQWEVITEAKEIPIAVPPGPQALSQWYEVWSGGGCQRRCDGVTEQMSGRACLCGPDQAQRVCRPTTRVNIILPDVNGLGVWRLESKGWNSAHELGATAETLATVRAAGVIVPAVLRLEQRKSIQGGQTRDFVVPVLALRHTMRELSSLSAGTVELPAAPPTAKAIGAAPAGPVTVTEPAPSAEVPPETPAGMAALVEACTDASVLKGRLARYAQGRNWMDEFVQSRYSPDEDTMIELVEVFRARQDELSAS